MGKGPKVSDDTIKKVRQRIRQTISDNKDLQKAFDQEMSQGPAPQDEAARRQKLKLATSEVMARNPLLQQEADRIFKEESGRRP